MPEHQNPWLATRRTSGESYDETYERRAAAGEDVHGEANFVCRYPVASVLDAGCGTGRVTRELARRGLDVAGVDLDAGMLATGQRKAPEIDFRVADLEIVALARTFEAILMAGNVMIFLTPGSEGRVLKNLARHLTPGGFVIAGFQLRPGGLDVERYDTLTADAGLVLYERFATWDGDPWRPGGNYAVSVHRSAGR